MTEMTGGCQCGRIRYRAGIAGDAAALCHCGMCRKATGGAAMAFVTVPLSAIQWQAEPDWYVSSPIARRAFCKTCGSPLAFRFEEDADTIDITLGSFDDPSHFSPNVNYASERILPAWQDTASLPNISSDNNPAVAGRWIRTIGKLPD